MAKKRVTNDETVSEDVVENLIDLVSIDYGREDINNLARKVNEIIVFISRK